MDNSLNNYEKVRQYQEIETRAKALFAKLETLDDRGKEIVEAFADGYGKGYKAGVRASMRQIELLINKK